MSDINNHVILSKFDSSVYTNLEQLHKINNNNNNSMQMSYGSGAKNMVNYKMCSVRLENK
jgi:hypothetical protein